MDKTAGIIVLVTIWAIVFAILWFAIWKGTGGKRSGSRRKQRCRKDANGYIYALKEPYNATVWYIGQTVNPSRRLQEHIDSANPYSTRPVCRWIWQLVEVGQVPKMEVLLVCRKRDVLEIEKQMIEEYRAKGAPLLNVIHNKEANWIR